MDQPTKQYVDAMATGIDAETLRRQWAEAIASVERSWRVPIFEGCEHDLKTYTGFREIYQYCTKCDHKQDVEK